MNDPIREAQDAIRRLGQHAHPGAVVVEFVLRFHDGRKMTLPVPLVAVPAERPAVVAPPIIAGWDFSEPLPRFDGRMIRIQGQRLALLKLLAEAEGPLAIEALKAAWSDGIAEEGTVRWTILKLNEALKAAFPDAFPDAANKPITSGPSGYTLAIK